MRNGYLVATRSRLFGERLEPASLYLGPGQLETFGRSSFCIGQNLQGVVAAGAWQHGHQGWGLYLYVHANRKRKDRPLSEIVFSFSLFHLILRSLLDREVRHDRPDDPQTSRRLTRFMITDS